MNWFAFSDLEELTSEKFLIKEINGKSIGVMKTGNEVHGIWNRCPHAGAEICKGKIGGTNLPSAVGEFNFGLENQIVSCPWHGWEFDIKSGKPMFESQKPIKLLVIATKTEDGKVFVKI